MHRGSAVVLGADGEVVLRLGSPDRVLLPRSANKPMQAAGMLECGLAVESELLALAAASHSGEPFHLDGTRRLLAGAGLAVGDLQTPPDDPHDAVALREWIRAGHGPEPVAMNCSGKHAAMLATCVAAGWDTGRYLDPGHPLQVHLRSTLERLAGEPVAVTAVDGCGAPALGLSLTGLARAARACVLAGPATAERRVADAMRSHPEWVGGSSRDVTALMRAVPGLLAKDGAEGVQVVALADGRAFAVKVDDGAPRARQVVIAALLLAMGVDAPEVRRQGTAALTGGRRTVGEVRPVALPSLARP